MINLIKTAILDGADQFKCHECNHLNTATDYAVNSVKAGNIHIASCKGCGARSKLTK